MNPSKFKKTHARFESSKWSSFGNLEVEKTLEDVKDWFLLLNENKPTLEEALREAKIPDHDIVLKDAMLFANLAREDPEIASLGLTDDEAGAISCYTFEYDEGKSPYKVINDALAGSRDRKGLFEARRLIYLLLSGLRKLPRFRPSRGQMFYRGIRDRVPTTKEDANGHQFYAKGRTVTWWGFTSTTTNIEATDTFIKGAEASTLFNIGGEDLWGYDIKAFSPFKKEEEVLLEPETKVLVDGILTREYIKSGSFTTIQVTFQKAEPLVLEDVIPVRCAKESPIKSGLGEPKFKFGFGSPSKASKKSSSPPSPPSPPAPVKKSGSPFSTTFAKSPSPPPAPIKKSGSPFSTTFAKSPSPPVSKPAVKTPEKTKPLNDPKEDGKKKIAWKECPDDVKPHMKYTICENPRIATKNNKFNPCVIIGNTSLPPNKVISWSIKVLKSNNNDGGGIYIGVAPSNIDQNEGNNYNNCGWYFDCYGSTLFSGPPRYYGGKEYGPRKGLGEYVHTGDIVGVVMDTSKGKLSFVLDGVNLGVAYERIPLDKPLVPCVLLCGFGNDSVELDTPEVKENMTNSNFVLSNIIAKSTTWDSITLTWNAVEGVSSYQIEMDGSKSWYTSTTNTFSIIEFLPDTEHTFRIRAVRGNSVSGWSDVVKGKTQKKSFKTSGWKRCPDYVGKDRKYSVDGMNPRIATKIGESGNWCTIIGNTSLPLNKVTSWSIKILKSEDSNGGGIFIGVAPSDINQDEEDNFKKCGWYFVCYASALFSGPPHYCCKEYGPRKEREGQYVHTGDSVGVVMDTSKGKLSFVLDGVNLGVAYEGIPLDKPLVPCVILGLEGDSVELVI